MQPYTSNVVKEIFMSTSLRLTKPLSPRSKQQKKQTRSPRQSRLELWLGFLAFVFGSLVLLAIVLVVAVLAPEIAPHVGALISTLR